ncbi:MAG: hypothetical protein AB8G96_13515 [Phycisphaerales bacterium]
MGVVPGEPGPILKLFGLSAAGCLLLAAVAASPPIAVVSAATAGVIIGLVRGGRRAPAPAPDEIDEAAADAILRHHDEQNARVHEVHATRLRERFAEAGTAPADMDAAVARVAGGAS